MADGLTLVSAGAASGFSLTSRSGSITLADGARVAGGTVTLVAETGAIVAGSGAGAGTQIAANHLSLSAQGDIGAAAAALSLSVASLSAHSAAGSVYLSEADGLTLVSAGAASGFSLTSRNGSITLADGARVAAETVTMVAGSSQLVENARATVAAWVDTGIDRVAPASSLDAVGSSGSIYLRADASIVASQVSIAANSGAIHAGANSRIAATELKLSAQSHIGSAAESLILMVDHLSVTSRQGSVYLIETDGVVLGSSSAKGQFDLVSLQGTITIGSGAIVSADVISIDSRHGAINAGPEARLQANTLRLSAQDGIGSRTAPIPFSLVTTLELNSGHGSVHLIEADGTKLRKMIAQALEFTSAAGSNRLRAGAASAASAEPGVSLTATAFPLTARPDIGLVTPQLEWLEEGLDDASDADDDSALQQDDAPALQVEQPSDSPSQPAPAPAAGVAAKALHKLRLAVPAPVPEGEQPAQPSGLDEAHVDAGSDINATNLALLGLFTLQASEVRPQSGPSRQRRKSRKSKPVASATMPQSIDLSRVDSPAADGLNDAVALDSPVPDLAGDEPASRRGGWFQRLGRWLDTQTVGKVEPGSDSGRSGQSDRDDSESGAGR